MRKKGLLVLFFLFLLNFFAWREVYILSRPGLLEVVFVDIGQGDATLIKTPSGHRILIDGGLGSKVLGKISDEIPFYDRRIDLVILTHPHSDHLQGLLSVLESYEVESIIWTGAEGNTNDFKIWKEMIKEKKNVFVVKAGARVRSGKTALNILYPFEILEGKNSGKVDNTSIIARLVYGDNSFLFTGDSHKEAEIELVDFEESCSGILCEIVKLDSDVLKAGHHGSKTSTSEEFLKAVSPQIAVISSGKDNRYGHPHEEVLALLNKFGIDILRTDELGDIKIISDGLSLKIAN